MYRVLVVDDEPEIARALQRVLRKTYAVELASSGTHGLAKLDVYLPDVVISDFQMPKMNGAEFLREVHWRLPNSVRLLLSGLAEFDLSALPDAGSVSRFIKKPWKNDELLQLLAALLNGHARAAA
jgi:two-component system response regulator VicR